MTKEMKNEIDNFLKIYAEEEKKYSEIILNEKSSLSDFHTACFYSVESVINWVKSMNEKGIKKSQIYNYLKNIENKNEYSDEAMNAFSLRSAIRIYTRGEKLL